MEYNILYRELGLKIKNAGEVKCAVDDHVVKTGMCRGI